jgi:hypothetical protein
MKTSGNSPKSSAPSTPAEQPPESLAGAESDALPSHGAERGDILGIKALLGAELGQLSDGQNDENDDANEAEQSAKLEDFDEQQAAPAADAPDEAAGAAEDAAAEANAADGNADGQSDAAAEQPPSTQKPGSEKPPGNERFQERIDELTARAKSAEEQLTQLQEQVASYRARDEGKLGPDALDHVETPDDLSRTETKLQELLGWAIRNSDGGKLGDKDLTAEEVRDLHANVQTMISANVPRRREYLAQRTEADRRAVDHYPWLKDTTKGAGALVQKAVQQIPAIRQLPNYRMIAADALIGQSLRENGVQVTDALLQRLAAEAKGKTAAGKPAADKPKPPAAPGRAGVLPPRLAPRAAAAKAAGQRLRQSQGTEDDLAASIATKL